MSYHPEDRHHFFLFKNKEVTSLYLTSSLLTFVEGLIGIFIPIYLWKIGYELWEIFLFFAVLSVAFVFFSFALLPVLRRLSDKAMMLTGIPFRVIFYYGFSFLPAAPWLFFALPAIAAVANIMINVGYNLDFSGASDERDLGKEVGLRFSMSSLTKFGAPFMGGVLIALFSFNAVFIIASLILVASVLPLFFFPPRRSPEHLNARVIWGHIKNKSIRPFNFSAAGYAVEKSMGMDVWPLFIFLTLGSLEQFGGIISLSLLAGVVTTYGMGVLTDRGKRRTVITVSVVIGTILWVTRLFILRPAGVALSNIAGGLNYSGLIIPWSTQYYKLAQATHVPGVFIVSREVLYNLSRAVVMVVLTLVAFVASGHVFNISYVIGAGATLLFLYANKEHTRNLDTFIKEGT